MPQVGPVELLLTVSLLVVLVAAAVLVTARRMSGPAVASDERLAALDALHDRGTITDEELEAARLDVLNP